MRIVNVDALLIDGGASTFTDRVGGRGFRQLLESCPNPILPLSLGSFYSVHFILPSESLCDDMQTASASAKIIPSCCSMTVSSARDTWTAKYYYHRQILLGTIRTTYIHHPRPFRPSTYYIHISTYTLPNTFYHITSSSYRRE
jgi:hypothetical protein